MKELKWVLMTFRGDGGSRGCLYSQIMDEWIITPASLWSGNYHGCSPARPRFMVLHKKKNIRVNNSQCSHIRFPHIRSAAALLMCRTNSKWTKTQRLTEPCVVSLLWNFCNPSCESRFVPAHDILSFCHFVLVFLVSFSSVKSFEKKNKNKYKKNLFADSSLTVKDVIKEFQPGGRLAKHKHGEVRKLFLDSF